MHTLPLPDADALAHSQQLTAQIIQRIQQTGGMIPFSDFMQQALYAPSLGYYSAGSRKFGAEGDFITAPELSPLFSRCLARQCQQVLSVLNEGVILEFGAGLGSMAADILLELQQLNCLPTRYFILEISAELRQRQQMTLQAKIPDLLERVTWLDQLPTEPIRGVILANEVLDAMPVHRFRIDSQAISECYVSHDGTQFTWQFLPTRDELLRQQVEKLRSGLPVNYISETNPNSTGWIHSLADILATGLILLIDYGFPRREYYHPQRHEGTLLCHYRHHVHSNPLILVGLQDITAHVDFTAVAEAAIAAGLQLSGYTTQANFLLACGLTDLLASYDANDTQHYLRLAQQVKLLILPSEMGELFKVMALTREFNHPLLGFERSHGEL